MSAIEIKQLEKKFDETIALLPADLKVQEGEFVVFVGPSGCGKTTFLRMIAGLEESTAGEIWIGEKNVTHLEPKNREVAMVFQNYALYPHMTIQQNLEYPLNILKTPKKEKQAKMMKVAKLLEIDHLLTRKPGQLSGGQKQRVAIGRALVREPKVFLFDEPLSNLDARLREQMRVEIQALHLRLGRTTIYVTHDQHEAMTLGDRLVVMNVGEIMEIGPPLELYQNPQTLFVAEFLGHPSLNVLQGKIEGSTFSSEGIVSAEVSLGKDAGAVTLAFRPEHLNLAAPENKQGICFSAKIEHQEHLGREVHLQLQIPGQPEPTLRMVVSSGQYQTGQELKLHVPEEYILLFDAEGQRIRK